MQEMVTILIELRCRAVARKYRSRLRVGNCRKAGLGQGCISRYLSMVGSRSLFGTQ